MIKQPALKTLHGQFSRRDFNALVWLAKQAMRHEHDHGSISKLCMRCHYTDLLKLKLDPETFLAFARVVSKAQKLRDFEPEPDMYHGDVHERIEKLTEDLNKAVEIVEDLG